MGECKVCGRILELREDVCFNCVEFESLIEGGIDMYDKPIKLELPNNTKSMNILYQILKCYKLPSPPKEG